MNKQQLSNFFRGVYNDNARYFKDVHNILYFGDEEYLDINYTDTSKNEIFFRDFKKKPITFIDEEPIEEEEVKEEPVEEEEVIEDVEPVVEETIEEEDINYKKMKVVELKKLCKEKGMKGYTKLKKAELVELLENY